MTIKVVDGEDDGKVTLSAREPQDGSSVLATLDDPDGGETAVEWQWYRGGDDEDTADELAALTAAIRTHEHRMLTLIVQ